MSAYAWFVEYLKASGSGQAGRMWQCPAHDDASPSLSVAPGRDGIVLLRCFAGCPNERILWALGLGVGLLFEPHPYSPERVLAQQAIPPRYPLIQRPRGSRSNRSRGCPVETVHHVYVPDRVRLERRRYADGGKDCTWEWRVGHDWEFAQGLALEKLPVYQQTQVRMGVASGEPIIVCESESSVDALMKAGLYATTWAGGASTPQASTLKAALAGARVILIPDHDPAGLRCHDVLVPALHDVCDLSVLLPAENQDARDLLTQWGSAWLREAITRLPSGHAQAVLMTR